MNWNLHDRRDRTRTLAVDRSRAIPGIDRIAGDSSVRSERLCGGFSNESNAFRETLNLRILIDEDRIRRRVGELALRIEADYAGKPLTIVAVLTGSLILLADLMRRIHLPLRVALLQASSYRGATTTAGSLVLNTSFLPSVEGRDVLLLDDILDTGRTLVELVDHVRDRGANSVRTAVLLRKLGRQIVAIEPDYVGFEIPDAFVVGYGLDFNDDHRHLPYIAVLEEILDA